MRWMQVLVPALLLLAINACSRPPQAPPTDPGTSTTEARRETLWIDLREPVAFAAGHHDGAINIQLGWNQLEDRMEAYVPRKDTSLVVVAKSDSQLYRARGILDSLGYESVTTTTDPGGSECLQLMKVEELLRRLDAGEDLEVIDVRSAAEFESGVLDMARLVDEDEAPSILVGLDKTKPYAIICEGGYRSSQLASLMKREGFTQVWNVIDGMWAWRQLRQEE